MPIAPTRSRSLAAGFFWAAERSGRPNPAAPAAVTGIRKWRRVGWAGMGKAPRGAVGGDGRHSSRAGRGPPAPGAGTMDRRGASMTDEEWLVCREAARELQVEK